MIGLTTAALEYAPRGIRINAVRPGTIDTPLVSDMIAKGELDPAEAEAGQPINRHGTADGIAQAVLWLCSPGVGFVVGVALPVDGGYVARWRRGNSPSHDERRLLRGQMPSAPEAARANRPAR